MTDPLHSLYERFMADIDRSVEEGARTPTDMFRSMEIDRSAFLTGCDEFKRRFSSDPSQEEAGIAFAFAFAAGLAAGIRRAATAAATPLARGREAELFGWLLAGVGVDAAMARLAAKEDRPTAMEDGAVVPFRRAARKLPVAPSE